MVAALLTGGSVAHVSLLHGLLDLLLGEDGAVSGGNRLQICLHHALHLRLGLLDRLDGRLAGIIACNGIGYGCRRGFLGKLRFLIFNDRFCDLLLQLIQQILCPLNVRQDFGLLAAQLVLLVHGPPHSRAAAACRSP